MQDAMPFTHALHTPCPPLSQLTEEAWGRSLEQAVDAGPHHISTYDLQVRICAQWAAAVAVGG